VQQKSAACLAEACDDCYEVGCECTCHGGGHWGQRVRRRPPIPPGHLVVHEDWDSDVVNEAIAREFYGCEAR
jgi:hypothetical protein